MRFTRRSGYMVRVPMSMCRLCDRRSGVRAGQLDASERSWYLLLDGLLADLEGRPDVLEVAFRRAEAAAVSPEQRAFFRVWSCVRSSCGRLPVRRWLRRFDASWMG